jgi:signal transduction histidine kinase
MGADESISQLESALAQERLARQTAERRYDHLKRELVDLKHELKHELALRGRNAAERIAEASSLQDALIELDRLRERDRWQKKQSALVIDVLQALGSLVDPQTAPQAALRVIGNMLGTQCIGLLHARSASQPPVVLAHEPWWDRFAQEGSLLAYLDGRQMRVITQIESVPLGRELLTQWPDGNLDLLASVRVERDQSLFLLIIGASTAECEAQGLRLLLPRMATLVAEALQRREDAIYREKVEVELAQARRLEALGSLASGIAHEMNTPMQYISDNLHFIKDAALEITVAMDQMAAIGRDAGLGFDVDKILTRADYSFLRAEIPAAVEQSITGTRRLSEIIKAIKTFSYADASDRERFNPTEVIDNCLLVSRRVWKNVAEVQVEFDENPVQIQGDPVRLSQAVIALISNACEAIQTQPGWRGPKHRGSIKITIQNFEHDCLIVFDDSGPGIPAALRTRIFDPFFTTKEVGKGMGQGLNQCQSIIVKGFGGRIEVDDSPLGGARINLWLPLAGHESNTGD